MNIFLTKSGFVKVGDFGIARMLTHTAELAASIVGTPYYLSPEIVQSNAYNYKSDIWSLGILLYEMCALKPPFNGANLHMLATQIVSGTFPPIPSHFSPNMHKMVHKLLQVEPDNRPTIAQIL